MIWLRGLCSYHWRGEQRQGHTTLAEIGGVARMRRIRGAGLIDAENGAVKTRGGGGANYNGARIFLVRGGRSGQERVKQLAIYIRAD